MNAVERVLSHEVTELLERLAAAVPGGCLAAVAATQPTLRKRLDEAEDRLTDARAALLDDYGRWRRALEDVENLWALGACRITGEAGPVVGAAVGSLAAEEPIEPASSMAA